MDARFRNNPLDHKYPLMQHLGSDASRDMFELPGGRHVISIGRPGGNELSQSMFELERLRNMKVPVGPVADIGSYGGRQAIVTEKYPQVALWSRPDSPAGQAFIKSPLVNAKTIHDIKDIILALKTHRISIQDFQLGIGLDGHAKLLNPVGVHRNKVPVPDNADQIDTLRQFITEIEHHHHLTHVPF